LDSFDVVYLGQRPLQKNKFACFSPNQKKQLCLQGNKGHNNLVVAAQPLTGILGEPKKNENGKSNMENTNKKKIYKILKIINKIQITNIKTPTPTLTPTPTATPTPTTTTTQSYCGIQFNSIKLISI
jgi:hypothetical protein